MYYKIKKKREKKLFIFFENNFNFSKLLMNNKNE